MKDQTVDSKLGREMSVVCKQTNFMDALDRIYAMYVRIKSDNVGQGF